MTVRRSVARLAVVGALSGGLLVVGATPALADEDSVRVRAAGNFTVGGSAESVSVEVRKRTRGCVVLRTGLGLRLPGVAANQVEVQVAAGGQWWPVPVSGGGVLSTARTSPANPTLCKGKSVTVRYRVTLLAGAPGGTLTVTGEVTTAGGRVIGRATDAAQVRAGRQPTPSPKPTKSATPSPTPTPTRVETGPPTEAPTVESALAGAGGGGVQAADEGGSGGGLSMVMVFGVVLVLAGLGLILLLFRRSRADRREVGSSNGPTPQPPLPGNPGGTTYRSGGVHSTNPATSGGYPAGPATSGGYPAGPASGGGYPAGPVPPGGRAGDPARGTVYPSSPRSAGQPPSGTVYPASPSGPAYPASLSGQVYPASSSGQASPASPSGQGYPEPRSGQPGAAYPAPRSGQPGTPPLPESTGGGDSTTVMPRLPE